MFFAFYCTGARPPLPRVFRRIGNKIIRLSLLITKTRRAKQLFSLLSYLYIYVYPVQCFLLSIALGPVPLFTCVLCASSAGGG